MGCSKPFDDLDVDHLGQELVARGIYDFERTKKERLQLLKETLKGIQRVPTLLLNNPTETLTQVHLEGYTILDCEPLHDIKGHIDNLLQELPHILETELSNEVEQLLQVDLWSKKKQKRRRLQASNYSCIKLVKRTANTTKNTTTGGNSCRFVMPNIPGGSK